MGYQFSNYASTALSVGIDTIATVITVDDATDFPTPAGGDVFNIVIEDASGVYEICTCTARVGNSLTVTRGVETSQPQTFGAGAIVELRLTKEVVESFMQASGATMSGPLTMAGNDILTAALVSPTVSGGVGVGTALRGSDNGVTNELLVQPAGAGVTIGSETIWHTGTFDPADKADTVHTHDTADIVTGTLADALVAESNVTQHKGAMDILPVVTDALAAVAVDETMVGKKIICTYPTGDATATVDGTNFDATHIGMMIFLANRTGGTLTVAASNGATLLAANDVTPIICASVNGVVALHCTAAKTFDVAGDY